MPEHAATKVVARRVGAILVDTAVLVLLSAIAWFALVHRFDSKTSRGGGFVIGHTRYAFDNSTSRAVWLAIVVVLALAIFVVLPGLRGISPGKALAGIRIVNSAGAPPGIGRALVRELLWIGDLFPYFLPGLVGFVVARSSRGNQRVGDMAASTWVVRRSERAGP